MVVVAGRVVVVVGAAVVVTVLSVVAIEPAVTVGRSTARVVVSWAGSQTYPSTTRIATKAATPRRAATRLTLETVLRGLAG